MTVVKGLGSFDIFGIRQGAGFLMAQQGGLNIGGEFLTQAIGFLHPCLHACGGVGDDEGLESLGLADRMFGSKHAAPRLAEIGIAVLDAEMIEKRVEFVEKQIDGPEVLAFFRKAGGIAVAELVIVNDRTAIDFGDALEAVDIVMGAAGTAMGDDQRQLSGIK